MNRCLGVISIIKAIWGVYCLHFVLWSIEPSMKSLWGFPEERSFLLMFASPIIIMALVWMKDFLFYKWRKKEIITKDGSGVISVSCEAIKDFVLSGLLAYDFIQEASVAVKVERSKVYIKIELEASYIDRTMDIVKVLQKKMIRDIGSLIGVRVKLKIDIFVKTIEPSGVIPCTSKGFLEDNQAGVVPSERSSV